MTRSEAQRTLVKSPPELWAELSELDSLARHLGDFGEIRIARTQPEETVEWEAQNVRGTVRIEPSGWGTRVTLTVIREAPEPLPETTSEPEPRAETGSELETQVEAEADPEPAPKPRPGLFARLFRRRRVEQPISEPDPELTPEPPRPTPEPTSQPTPEPSPAEAPPDLSAELAQVEDALTERDAALLSGVLDRLGAAHHRPFSRA